MSEIDPPHGKLGEHRHQGASMVLCCHSHQGAISTSRRWRSAEAPGQYEPRYRRLVADVASQNGEPVYARGGGGRDRRVEFALGYLGGGLGGGTRHDYQSLPHIGGQPLPSLSCAVRVGADLADRIHSHSRSCQKRKLHSNLYFFYYR